MIKFFRKIRYNLMEQNKTGKYLKYAIGEIILVVIGILIALQINNWNEERKSIRASRDYLSEIKKDLVTDTLNMNRVIRLVTKSLPVEIWALQNVTYKPSQADSLHSIFNQFYYAMGIEQRSYQKLQNSGTSIVGFDSISNKLTTYHTTTSGLLDAYLDGDKEEFNRYSKYTDSMMGKIEIRTQDMRVREDVALLETFTMLTNTQDQDAILISFFTSVRGRNYLKSGYERHLSLLRGFKMVKQHATTLIHDINKTLEQ
ncbi:DUF6090 family protein [Formosa maritima]|uniref:Uncharacterized protein n=1 Tax=Formosa maritima TaxID=2592046 RepID=A0A5D0G618_9FLAO|nr:DUF6090 family protein [Formosa maritima]TYA54315.1 hypothetical protein FVF61_08845 [Formosa maritima]